MTITELAPETYVIPDAKPDLEMHGSRVTPWHLITRLWATRDLIVILARKDFHTRYRRASFGLLWSVFLPLFQATVMALVFSVLLHVSKGRFAVPHYAAYVISGMTAWLFVTTTLISASTSIVDGSGLTSKVYFPRSVVPIEIIGSNIYGLLITAVIMMILCPILGAGLGVHTLFVLLAVPLMVAMVTGMCLTLSAMHVYFRDVRYIVGAIITPWLYLTPIIYPPGYIHNKLKYVVDVNPMTGVIDTFHRAFWGNVANYDLALWVSLGWIVFFVTLGIYLHSRFDRVFGDLL